MAFTNRAAHRHDTDAVVQELVEVEHANDRKYELP